MTTVAQRLGAWPVAADGVEFRVWAPDARTMALCLRGTQQPMQRDPDGCHWCGNRSGNHGSQYIRPVGLHKWTRPTDAQRLARMKARRTQQKEQS